MSDPTTDEVWALELVERSQRDVPFCEMCGAATVPVASDGGAIWLECSSLSPSKPVLRRLLTLDFAGTHTRQPIIDAVRRPFAA